MGRDNNFSRVVFGGGRDVLVQRVEDSGVGCSGLSVDMNFIQRSESMMYRVSAPSTSSHPKPGSAQGPGSRC